MQIAPHYINRIITFLEDGAYCLQGRDDGSGVKKGSDDILGGLTAEVCRNPLEARLFDSFYIKKGEERNAGIPYSWKEWSPV